MTPQVNTAPTPPQVNTAPTGDQKVIKRNLFNLETFKKESKASTITLVNPKSVAEALQLCDSDEEKFLRAIVKGMRALQISEEKQKMGGENLVSPKAVSGIVNSLRAIYPTKDDSKEAKAEQTEKVYAHIRRVPALLEATKAIAMAFAASAEEDDDDTADDSDAAE